MVVIVRYGELAIKRGSTRRKMEELLIRAIREATSECGTSTTRREPGRIFIYSENDECVAARAARVFGVVSASPAHETTFNSLEELAKWAAGLWAKEVAGRKFAVRVHRVGVHNFTSRDVAARVGALLAEAGGKVDLESPDVELYIEVRGNRAYAFDKEYRGPGGLPLGSEGKVLALVSGGIDSPVAAWYIMRRGAYADILHCSLGGSLALSATLKVIERLLEWSYGYNARVYVADCAKIADSIRRNIDSHLWSIAFKRALYRLAEVIARRAKAQAIVTGESLGQVSSQTLQALSAVEKDIDMPVLRPLIGLDKEEIVEAAKRIGTYELSTQVPEYCAIFSREPRRWASTAEIEAIDLALWDIIQATAAEAKVYKKTELREVATSLSSEAHSVVIDQPPPGAVIVDLRDEESYAKWHLPGAVRVDVDKVFDFVEKMGRDNVYVFYCYTGGLSADVAERLRKSGYKAYSLSRKS